MSGLGEVIVVTYALQTMNNTGSLSYFYYVTGTAHQVMRDWATGWYRVIGRMELPSVRHKTAFGFRTFKKYKELGLSPWFKDKQSLDNFLRSIINHEQEDPSIMGWTI